MAREPANPREYAIERRNAVDAATAELRERKWAIGVLGVSSARNLVIGAFDVLLVVVALQALELGDRGPGLLSALVGAGAVVSMLAASSLAVLGILPSEAHILNSARHSVSIY